MRKELTVVAGIVLTLSIGCSSDDGAGTDTENSGGARSGSGGQVGGAGERASGGESQGGQGTGGGSDASGGTGSGAGGNAPSAGGTAAGGGSSGGTSAGGAPSGGTASGGSSSGGAASGGASSGGAGSGEPCAGGVHLETQTRTRFATATVPSGQSCVSEQQTRTCHGGQWSGWTGTYTHETCTPGSGGTIRTRSCLLTTPITQCSEWRGENLEPIQCPTGTLGEGCPTSGVQGICELQVSGIVSRSYYYSSLGIEGAQQGCTAAEGEWITP